MAAHIVIVNSAREGFTEAVEKLSERLNLEIDVIVLREENYKATPFDTDEGFKILICDYNDPVSIQKALQPFQNDLLAITARGEPNAIKMAKIVPNTPYLLTASESSIAWATDKTIMRKRFAVENSEITPKYMIATSDFEETIQLAKEQVGFPLMIKPAGLMSSLLITDCKDEASLRERLRVVFDEINSVYKSARRQEAPVILIEEKMEGDLYSIDPYIDNKGKTYHTPICRYYSGHKVGIEDYYVYQRDTFVDLSDEEIAKAQKVTEDGLHALGLRNSTAHVELIQTSGGWKIIEIGPRIGRFRDKMYELSFGIDHSLNDLLIRIPDQSPHVSSEPIAYTSAFTFFAKNEGIIKEVNGLNELEKFDSFYSSRTGVGVGGKAKFSRNGGKMVAEVILSNKELAALSADINKMESLIDIIME